MYNLDLFRRLSLMGTTLCAAPNNLYAISTNYHDQNIYTIYLELKRVNIILEIHVQLLNLNSKRFGME